MLTKVYDNVQLVIVWNIIWNIFARGLLHLMDKEYPNHFFFFFFNMNQVI